MTGYVACCCDPGFRIHISSSLSINWKDTLISFGEPLRDFSTQGSQTLSVRGTFTNEESEVFDLGSSVSQQTQSFGTLASSIDGFVDLNQTLPSGLKRVPAAVPIFFPGLTFWTVGIGDASDCLQLEDGSIYARASLGAVADPGDFDNGSAGYLYTVYDSNGDPDASEVRRGTPIQGNSGGSLIRVPMVSDVSRAYGVLNTFPNSDEEFISDLGLFDPTPDAYFISDINFTDTSILPEFDLLIDGFGFGRDAVQTRDPDFLCALRRCNELHVKYRFEPNSNQIIIGDFLTTRDSAIIDYAIV